MAGRGVAIIGVSGIYPDAENLQQFALNLAQGRDSVREISTQRKALAGLEETVSCYPIASLEKIDKFDHEFFGISLKEAEYMDPQQRLLLQLACAAIENAGYSLKHFRGSRTATIVSASNNDYSKLYWLFDPSMITGQLPGALAGRIAYSLDLRGPAMVIDTACSSSLLAIHEAYEKVASGQVDYALAGGINIYFINPESTDVDPDAATVGISSPDGRCKTFDASANGAGWGEGGGLVLLKSLHQAVADRDHVYAVIKGGGVNQDGGRSNGLAAPSPQAQADAIVEACKNAGISPATISYLEAHGTGTELGDPIEIQGITEAFKQFTTRKQFCAISALKTNIGHLATAAGIAGLTKVILSFKQKQLYPSLHFREANPFIDFKSSPVFVNTELRDWEVDETVAIRRAGISSFGLSGTNVHLVLEEAPAVIATARDEQDAPVLVTHSAKTPEALRRNLANLATFLETTDDSLADIAYTLNLGRNDYQYRFACVVSSCQELRQSIAEHLSELSQYQKPEKGERSLVFLLPGDSQVSDDVIDRFSVQYPAFRKSWEECQTNGTRAAFDPNVRLVALFYSLYRACLSLGLSSPNVIGTGVGNLAVAIITGRLQLLEGLKQAASYRNGDVRPDPLKLKTVLDQIRIGHPLFLEFGQNTRLGEEIDNLEIDSPVLPLLNGNEDLLTIVAQLYLRGASVNWEKFYEASEHYRVELPSYSFEETSCWVPQISPAQPARLSSSPATASALVATEIYGELEEDANATERTLASIWGEVLKVKRLELSDDFFDLGGNSLDGTQIISRIKEAFDIRIEFETLYDYPTIALLGQYLDSLRSVTAPLEYAVSDQESAIEKGAGLVMSSGQQRLWFLDQLEPGTTFYNLPYALSIKGSLNVRALERSLQEVVRRHEVLRGTFSNLEGKAVSVIDWSLTAYLSVVDLRQLPAEQKQRGTEELTKAEARRPFDLEHGPMLRLSLLQLADHDYVLLLTLHHIVADRWSIQILIRELALLYEANLKGHASPLPELPIQYADYAQWQQEWLLSNEFGEHLEYWKQRLGGTAPVLNLPTDYPRPRVPTFGSSGATITFSKEVTAGLKELSHREGVTLFMVLTAAFQSLLHRYTQQREVSIGTPVAGRTRRETEALIGFFVNTLVLRTDFGGEPTFVELLQRVREVALGAYAHQEVPFEKLVEELEVERSLSHTPLFQVMMALQNTTLRPVELEDLEVEVLETESGTTQFDLVLYLTETEEELIGRLEYSVDLFAEETIKRLLDHFERLLEGVMRNPEARVSRLPLLSASERVELVERWNETEMQYENAATVVTAFERQVEVNGAAVAVVSGAAELRYAELNERANQVARYLKRKGVGAETVVGVCVERGVEMVTVLLGILKAGAVYLPLDPEYPWERLSYMVADAGVRVVLTERGVRERLAEANADSSVEWIELESAAAEIAQESVANLGGEISGSQLAYVIYTSGSTGQPKGVMIEHRNLSNFLASMAERPGLHGSDVLVAVTTFSFDIAGLELWLPLWVGGRVVIAVPEQARDAERLLELLRASGATAMQATPVTWRMLLEAGWTGERELKVLCGGEAMSRELAQGLVARSERVWNLYGPTETTIWSLRQAVARDKEAEWGTSAVVTLGEPLANTEVYVLDQALELVPVGVVGELYLGGAGVGRGYHGRAELTAEKFVPDGVSGRVGRRLYRTGDQVRYGKNGQLEYLGRADEQVKVRGFRIELGEIEGRLRAHAWVKECVVVRTGADETARLVGYVELHEGAGEVAELREYLAARLPWYMTPSLLMRVAQLPLTANGKVNRRALPAPVWVEEVREQEPVRTPTEEVVAGVWRQVLGAGELSRGANFFAVGGHSLLATQVMARLREIFAVELPLRTIFEHSTLTALSAYIDHARIKESPYSAEAITRVARDRALPLSFAQQRLWFIDRLEPNNAAYNIYAAAGLNGVLDVGALERSIAEVIRRHEVLRTTFAIIDDQPVQVIHEEYNFTLPLVDLSELEHTAQESELQRLGREAAAQPFRLDVGPLFRAFLIRRHAEAHAIIFTMHHVISDEWSIDVLIEEIATLYPAYSRGEQSPLPELPIQYADYAAWQREFLSGDVLARQVNYWKQQLADAQQVLELPTDHPRPKLQSFHGLQESLTLSTELSQALKDLSQTQGVTLFMLLLAAFQTLLFRYTQQRRINVGTPIAGRTRTEIESLIGFFVNTLVLSTDFSGDPTFAALLERVREVCLGAYEHQDVPFEKLVEQLGVERSLSETPLFRALFAMQMSQDFEFELPGLTLSAVAVENRTAKFDLTMNIFDGADSLTVDLNYSTELFEPETIRRMLRHFVQLLRDIVAQPRQRVSSLAILEPEEREDVVVRWNQTQANYPEESGLHQLFEQQVARMPNAPAVISAAGQLTYRELNEKANQLARHLRTLDAGPETLVAICAPRSNDMVVGLLAILKAACAYVPLDPDYPPDRLAYMLEDSGASILLLQSGMEARLPAHDATVVYIDRAIEAISSQSVDNLNGDHDPNSVAYIIYTSGSTGRPKGVLGLHRGAVNRLAWMWQRYPFSAGEVCCNKTSLNFGDSVWEIFGPLLQGIPIVMIPGELVQDVRQLAHCLAEYHVSRIVVVPSLLRELLKVYAGPLAGYPRPHLWVSSGEALSLKLAQDFAEVMGDAVLLNLYGSSEVAADVTYYPLEQLTDELSTVPIGWPIANTQIYLLDKFLQPVPVGIVGEVYAGGAGLARGYLNHSDLTAEKFLPNPFAATGGERLYQTGDLARYLPDGTIEYLGRVDHQVKVRGYRIELREVEVALNEHPAVKECVVVADSATPGDVRLVAYVVSHPAEELNISQLRRHLADKLPGYMVPALFMTLHEMPLTPSGKIARRALPPPVQSRADLESPFVAPRTIVEGKLAQIWSEVLKVERVGIDDNFFELGGHSLLATQVIARIHVEFGIELALRDFFTAPNIKNLAESVDQAALSITDEARIDEMLDQLDKLDEGQAELMLDGYE